MLHTLQTVSEVLVIACSILLKDTHLELNFKPPPPTSKPTNYDQTSSKLPVAYYKLTS